MRELIVLVEPWVSHSSAVITNIPLERYIPNPGTMWDCSGCIDVKIDLPTNRNDVFLNYSAEVRINPCFIEILGDIWTGCSLN